MIKLNPSRNLAARPRAGCFLALFLLAGLLALVTPLRADNPPTFLFEIDASAVPGGFQPRFVALDTSNNLYVTAGFYSQVEKFTRNGTYLTQWGSVGAGNGQFLAGPLGVAVDSSNNVYVADPGDFRVEKFDSIGTYLTQWGSSGSGNGQFDFPYGVAVDRSNNVYVTDINNNRVTKFTSNGTYLKEWGSSGSGNGQFNQPVGVGVDSSNNVYVADVYNNRVEKFTRNGSYLTQWGSLGSGNGQFSNPFGIAVDRSNNVYVVDYYNSRVEKFDSNGTYLAQWGSSGSGNGQFANPTGVAVDSSGNFIYVADNLNYRVQVFVNNTNIVPPIITSQPVSQIVPAGINVNFSVSVLGTAPFAYQWTSNNVAMPGATNATLTLTNAGLSNSGTYSVLVTNNFGSELSSNAVLAVFPVLVTTLPASGITATGAVLNGSVTVGPDETVVWIDWGMDTNYGNITGATIVPGNSGSNSISAVLSGLSGNYYHYRIEATNDFGIVHGDDQLFTVGFAPTAVTLSAINSTNGSTLNATVNPNGWDTTVYFQWVTPTLANTTPGMDIGAGATSLNVSSFVTGLAPFAPYHYQIVASNALGTVSGAVAFWNPPFVSVSGEAGVVFTSLHSFGGNDGANPYAGLVQGNDGNFYGTTYGDFANNVGTVFKFNTNGVLTSLHSFHGAINIPLHQTRPGNDGAHPLAGLVQGSDGYFYGTTFEGGTYGSANLSGFSYTEGTVFRISTNGEETILNSFDDNRTFGHPDTGTYPSAGLVQGSDGYFYGTTTFGFNNFTSQYLFAGPGDVFKMSTNGVVTAVFFFDGADGANPHAGLVQGSDGNFYGTTLGGGTNGGWGTVFKMGTNGALTTLNSFGGGTDGASPHAGLVQGNDGSFYGTTSGGGTNNYGTVFKISTNGAFTSLYSFTGGTDGASPRAGLVQGSDGSLYGTTYGGGSSSNGTVFAVNTNGTRFTTLYSFSASSTNSSGVYTNSDGANPQAGLILSGNTLYGTTSAGGIWGDGTVFSITLPPPPQLTIIPSGANVILTWPTNAAGFTLEFATNLVSPTVWNTNSTAPVVISGQNVVINPMSGPQQFYRLTQ
jgi:uncharacterized repeat protein (TIGR03803 family)